MPAPDGTPVDERIARELPPRPRIRSRLAMTAGAGLIVSLAALLAGWTAGSLHRRLRSHSMRSDLAGTLGEGDMDASLATLEELRRDDPDDFRLHALAAEAHMRAARGSASPEIHREYALEAVRTAWNTAGEEFAGDGGVTVGVLAGNETLFELRLTMADILSETGHERDALAAYEELLDALEHPSAALRPMLAATARNNAAYFLLVADDENLRDPDRALALAVACIETSPEASSSPILLDTLAFAYYAVGNVEQALTVQRRALATCPTEELPVLLEHYDTFREEAEEASRHGDADR